MSDDHFRCYVSNWIHPDRVKDFSSFITKMVSHEKKGELFEAQLRQNKSKGFQDAGMGYIFLLNDYDASVGCRFDQCPKEGIPQVTVMLKLDITPRIRQKRK